MKELIIMKIGGSVITDKNKYMSADKESILRVAKEIANARKKKKFDLVIVHGAGSFGHMPVKKYNITNGIFSEMQKLGFAHTYHSCATLSHHLISVLLAEGVPAIVVPPLTILSHHNKKIKKFDTTVLSMLLKEGYVPILRGDVVLDDVIGGSISSGDEQVPYLAKKLNAKRVIYGVDVDGIFTADPKTKKDAKLIPFISNKNINSILSCLEEAKTQDVTGGMRGKITELLHYATIPIYIVNAKKRGNIQNILLGKKVKCTEIRLK